MVSKKRKMESKKLKEIGGLKCMDWKPWEWYDVVISSENCDAFRAELERQNSYMARLRESDGFNLENVMEEPPPGLFLPFISVSSPAEHPCSKFVLYAKLGIHRYNMLQGKNLQFSSMSGVTDKSSLVKVTTLSCYIARPKSAGEPVEPVEPVEPYSLSQWPSSENDFKDKSRYYLLKKSEVQKYDWIRLYVEIAFAYANTRFRSPDLAKLVITRVAVQTGEPRKEIFDTGNAENATFYIKYKYFPKKCRFARDRIAIIRRTIIKKTGLLSLMFYQYFEDTLL